MSRPDLTDIFILTFDSCIQGSSTKLIILGQLLETLLQKTFATVLARKLDSYEINVQNLSSLLFKTAISKIYVWDETALNSAKTLSRIDLFIAMSHAMLFCDSVWRQSRQNSSWKIHCCYCLLLDHWDFHYAMWTLSKMIKSSECCFLHDKSIFIEIMRNFCSRIRCNSCLSHSQLWLWLNRC